MNVGAQQLATLPGREAAGPESRLKVACFASPSPAHPAVVRLDIQHSAAGSTSAGPATQVISPTAAAMPKYRIP